MMSEAVAGGEVTVIGLPPLLSCCRRNDAAPALLHRRRLGICPPRAPGLVQKSIAFRPVLVILGRSTLNIPGRKKKPLSRHKHDIGRENWRRVRIPAARYCTAPLRP